MLLLAFLCPPLEAHLLFLFARCLACLGILSLESLTLLAGVRNEEAFSVVTTSSNRFVAPIHACMPIVLEPTDVGIWLSGDFAALADRSDVALDVTGEQTSFEAQRLHTCDVLAIRSATPHHPPS